MTDLFEHADRYPIVAGHAKGSDTSKEAADRLTDRTAIHKMILEILDHHYPLGLTVDEIKPIIEYKLRRNFDRSTIAARFTELKSAKFNCSIIETPDKRLSPMNRLAHVYKINH